jgi:hypothetical protein
MNLITEEITHRDLVRNVNTTIGHHPVEPDILFMFIDDLLKRIFVRIGKPGVRQEKYPLQTFDTVLPSLDQQLH